MERPHIFVPWINTQLFACFKKAQSQILPQEVEHVPSLVAAPTGANGAGVAPGVPEGETIGPSAPRAAAVILLAIAAGGGGPANHPHVLAVKGSNIDHTAISHRLPPQR